MIAFIYEDLDVSGKCRKLHGKNMYTVKDRGHERDQNLIQQIPFTTDERYLK